MTSKKLKTLKEIEYLYNNMTTCETIRLKPHLEVIEKEFLELLPEYEENTKKLKALEIIKEKGVNVVLLGLVDLLAYNNAIKHKKESRLTQEEYDLLKEWLTNDK